jgi:hypothetical protein
VSSVALSIYLGALFCLDSHLRSLALEFGPKGARMLRECAGRRRH